MNVAYLSAFSALAGSAIGGVASIATTWLTQHSQDRSQRHAQSVGRRERLYGDFIDEASMLHIDALTHDQFDPSKFVQIYATIAKLRLFASADVVSKAEMIMRDVVAVYYLPNRDFTKRRDPPEANLYFKHSVKPVAIIYAIEKPISTRQLGPWQMGSCANSWARPNRGRRGSCR